MELTRGSRTSYDHAFAGGLAADRVGFAFIAGYRAALQVLVANDPEAPMYASRVVALCVTEQGGNHPRAIEASLRVYEPYRYELTGTKTWASIGPDEPSQDKFGRPPVLLVLAVSGTHPDGKPDLKLARVDASANGVTITRASAPFVPEIPHATIAFDRVDLHYSLLLPGDGYADYVKPFRTLEDLHVHAALLGYLVGVCRRHGFDRSLLEQLLALAHAGRSLASLPPLAPSTHVALAGLLALVPRVIADIEAAWSAAPDEELARWQRDRPLLAVASKARATRRERAWEALNTDPSPEDTAAPPASPPAPSTST